MAIEYLRLFFRPADKVPQGYKFKGLFGNDGYLNNLSSIFFSSMLGKLHPYSHLLLDELSQEVLIRFLHHLGLENHKVIPSFSRDIVAYF